MFLYMNALTRKFYTFWFEVTPESTGEPCEFLQLGTGPCVNPVGEVGRDKVSVHIRVNEEESWQSHCPLWE